TLGCALVAGRNLVPSPAAGTTAFRTFMAAPSSSPLVPEEGERYARSPTMQIVGARAPRGRREGRRYTCLVMPTYEDTCRDCGHTFDIVQKMTEEPLTVCPECGGSLRKVFAVPAIAFKGSGFYATDHGKKSKRPSETPEKAGAKGGTDKKEGSSTEGSR